MDVPLVRLRRDSCRAEAALTLPLLPMSALRCEVLFPGAAVASITWLAPSAGGARMCAGKHEALSCRMILPSLYNSSSTN